MAQFRRIWLPDPSGEQCNGGARDIVATGLCWINQLDEIGVALPTRDVSSQTVVQMLPVRPVNRSEHAFSDIIP